LAYKEAPKLKRAMDVARDIWNDRIHIIADKKPAPTHTSIASALIADHMTHEGKLDIPGRDVSPRKTKKRDKIDEVDAYGNIVDGSALSGAGMAHGAILPFSGGLQDPVYEAEEKVLGNANDIQGWNSRIHSLRGGNETSPQNVLPREPPRRAP
jgi:hypothetical protein